MSERLLTDLDFSGLHLEPALLRGLEAAGFTRCTPIQARALPRLLAGEDVAGQAQTGTGKTAAYLLALFHRLLQAAPGASAAERAADGTPAAAAGAAPRPRVPRALVLAPTRELAVQIHKDAEVLGHYTGLKAAVVFGGTGYESQRETLRGGVDIVIGTPGRLIDYYKQRVLDLAHIEVVVLDEADRMFDLGFIRDIRYLLRRMPPPQQRLNMLFSATLSLRVQELAYEHMNAPTLVDVSPEQVTVEQVRQALYHVSSENKIALLIGLLKRMDPTRTLVFVNTKRASERLAAYLEVNGLHAGVLSGDVPQRKRLRLLDRFRAGELPVLVATDVAARGLHIPDVSHVFNFDLPQDPEDYVHRVGRTARAGKQGDAVSLACEQYVYSLPDIEEFIGQKIPAQVVSDELLAAIEAPVRSRGRGSRPRGRAAGGEGRRKRRRRVASRG